MDRNEVKGVRLAFGNDMSRLVRGLAIVLMVANHSMPGRVIGFAVPLFSFLVGYGYNFSRSRGLGHSLSRIWHLLGNFWLILFGICLPAAAMSWNGVIKTEEVLLNMFGLHARFNFFCWYIAFYIVAMLLMPVLSRCIDRYGWKGLAALLLLFGASAWGLSLVDVKSLAAPAAKAVTVALRCAKYMPVVLAGYWMARRNLFARIGLKRSPYAAGICLAGLACIYFLRGLPYVQVLDFLWATLACGLVAALFGIYGLLPLRWLLNQLGVHSMGIWFLHALFFTHSTRGVFLPLVSWLPAGWARVVPILLLSWAMALLTDKVWQLLSSVRYPRPAWRRSR